MGSSRRLLTVVLVAVLVAVGGWIATLLVESPREAAAKASAPDPSVIAVPIENREVSDVIVTRGTVTPTQSVEALSELVASDAARQIISGHLPTVGQAIKAGELIVEVSGRPVLALQGTVPAYRDLHSGDVGADVRQLNSGLAAAGFRVSAGSDTYASATTAAVRSLYSRAGYESDGSVPAGEIAFVNGFPAAVTTVSGALGTPIADASVQLAAGALNITADIDSTSAQTVREGMAVEVTSEVLGKTVTAKVGKPLVRSSATAISGPTIAGAVSTPGPTPEGARNSISITIVPDSKLSSDWVGQSVRIRILSASTGKKVLAVPVTAIFQDGAGAKQIVVAGDDEEPSIANSRRIEVKTGVVGSGWVEITPRDKKIQAGQLVLLSAPTEGP